MKKSERTLLIVSITTVVILLGLLFIYRRYIKDENKGRNIAPMETAVIKQEDGINLEANYVEENLWEYTVTGTVPTPCHKVTVTNTVMESYPEQVDVNVEIKDSGDICAEVIQDVEEEGAFKASSEAQITLSVIR